MRPPLLRFFFPLHVSALLVRCGVLALFLVPGVVQGHRVSSVSLISYLNTDKNTYVLDVAMEVVPSEEQALNDQISPEDAAREFAQEYLAVMFDRKDQKSEISIETVDSSDEETPQEFRRQQVLTKLSGTIPSGAKEFLLYLDPSCPMAVVMVVIRNEEPSRRMQVILAGEYSRPVSIAPVVEGDPFSDPSVDTSAVPAAADGPGPGAELTPPGRAKSAFLAGWRSFLEESWLPWLLTIGLFLLTLGRKSVFAQVAALLVSEGLIVALVAWKLIPVPGWSAPALAAVIVLICGEALFHRRLRVWRVPLVIIAGLLAGFVLADSTPFATSFGTDSTGFAEVIYYLLGTESAFVLVALASAALLLALSRFEWYRRAVVQPVAIVLIGFTIFSGVEKYL